MKRYTFKSLQADIQALNKKLEDRNDPHRFVIDSRNNYTAIDLARPNQLAGHTVVRNLECGTPRQCLNACHEYMA
jgi:hypothetical protein